MKKIVLAPDKFKGSLSGAQFCEIVGQVLEKYPVNVVKLPLADGGDGTIDVMNYYLKGEFITVMVKDPLFRTKQAKYFFSKAHQIAFIEMAEASGMKCLKKEAQNCMHTTTYGTGELILNALNKGITHIILGLGGSATNDCGIGMAMALGYQFFDENDNLIQPIGSELIKIKKIDTSKVDPRLNNVKIEVACDVDNPLYGPNGAAYTYAQQKGANSKEIEFLDRGLKSFAEVIKETFNINPQKIKGAGAAGGMGCASVVFLKSSLTPGIDLIKKCSDFDKKITDAAWIITGEGQLDQQTLSGKAIAGVIHSAKKHKIPVAVFCGGSTLSKKELEKFGINYMDSVLESAKDLEDAITNVKIYLEDMAEKFFHTQLT